MEAIVIIFMVVVAVLIAAVAFSVWAIVAIGRGVKQLVVPKRRVALPPTVPGSVQVCSNVQCRCSNPSHARFCRRCGKSLPSLLRVVSNRVAVL